MFGNLATNPNPNPGASPFGASLSLFLYNLYLFQQTGAFGASNTTANTSNSLFGGAKPATGFGAFGGGTTSTFGSGGVFGQNTSTTPGTSTGLFGQPASTTTFGAGGTSLFNKPATSGFGSTQSR
jgi:nuclear pore complex protein Nup98-Nup96